LFIKSKLWCLNIQNNANLMRTTSTQLIHSSISDTNTNIWFGSTHICTQALSILTNIHINIIINYGKKKRIMNHISFIFTWLIYQNISNLYLLYNFPKWWFISLILFQFFYKSVNSPRQALVLHVWTIYWYCSLISEV